MAKRGRPKKYNDGWKSEALKSIEKYIDKEEIPILKEWCYQNKISSTYIYELEEFSEPIKRLLEKKESQLERKGLKGEIDRTMAVFSLKQLGWTDKQEIETKGNSEVEVIIK